MQEYSILYEQNDKWQNIIFHDKQFRYNNVNIKVINVSLFVLSMLFLEDKYK